MTVKPPSLRVALELVCGCGAPNQVRATVTDGRLFRNRTWFLWQCNDCRAALPADRTGIRALVEALAERYGAEQLVLLDEVPTTPKAKGNA